MPTYTSEDKASTALESYEFDSPAHIQMHGSSDFSENWPLMSCVLGELRTCSIPMLLATSVNP